MLRFLRLTGWLVVLMKLICGDGIVAAQGVSANYALTQVMAGSGGGSAASSASYSQSRGMIGSPLDPAVMASSNYGYQPALVHGSVPVEPTYVSGTIDEDTIWTLANSPYVVQDHMTVNAGVTLTIEPGVVIKFDGPYSLTIDGTVIAQGTVDQNIIVTSQKVNPAYIERWTGLYFNSSSSNSILSYVNFSNAFVPITISGADVIIDHIVSENNISGILLGYGTQSTVEHSTFRNNSTTGIIVEGNATSVPQPVIHYNAIYGNGESSLSASGSGGNVTIDARNNWWGTTDIEQIMLAIQDNSDFASRPVVDFVPFLDAPDGNPVDGTFVYGAMITDTIWTSAQSPYVVVGGVTVNPGVTLTIKPGVEVKFNGPYGLSVEGSLDAQGVQGNEIIFTSNKPVPGRGDWDAIRLRPSSINNILKHVFVRYAAIGVSVQESSVVIDHIISEENSFTGLEIRSASATVTNSVIRNNDRNGIVVIGTLGQPDPAMTINYSSIYLNGINNIATDGLGADFSYITIDAENNWWGSSEIAQIAFKIKDLNDIENAPLVDFLPFLDAPDGNPVDGTLVNQNISVDTLWSVGASPYFVGRNLIVAAGATLTIEPGVDVILINNNYIDILGTLIANGLPESPIRFTASGTSGWQYLKLSATSQVSYAEIEDAGFGIKLDGVSPTIQDCTFKYNGNGITILNGAAPFITGNRFRFNQTAIDIVPSLTNPALPVINYNFFQENDFNVITAIDQDYSAMIINAENNWWGSIDPVVIENSIFHNIDRPNAPIVDFEPFSTDSVDVMISNTSVSAQFFRPVAAETTTIAYTLEDAGYVTMRIYDFHFDILVNSRTLVRTLISYAAKPAGAQQEIWDGRDSAGNFLPAGVYVYTIEVDDQVNGLFGEYDPRYVTGNVLVENAFISPAQFSPHRGETARVDYSLVVPALVRLSIGEFGVPQPRRTLMNYVPREAGFHSEVWDGRDDFGEIAFDTGNYIAGLWANVLPDNAIVIKGEDSAFQIASVSVNPYAIFPAYDQTSMIKYELSHDANVTIDIVGPSGIVARTLVDQQNQFAGEHVIEWRGDDGIGGKLKEQGSYTIRVRATWAASGVTQQKDGQIWVF